jgi:Rho GTPase-activating protein 1
VVTEGLFRVPANARLRTSLREAYDRGQKFIIWKDNGRTLPVPPYRDAYNLAAIIEEVDQRDAYNAHMAAALCKMWYAELRHPLFPQSCYRDMKTQFGDIDPQAEISLDSLIEFIKPSSQWSSLPLTSREIILRHLLPLLYRVAQHSDENKMTPDNLATCFAPALLCGPDQIEDAKMSSVIRRILASAINLWEDGLRKGCDVDPEAFEQDLRPPPRIDDYEDPLDEQPAHPNAGDNAELGTSDQQYTGIIMKDNESGPGDVLPPLPPRPGGASGSGSGSGSHDDGTIRRRPAPPTVVPPRYSTIVAENPIDVSESPTSWAMAANGFAPSHAHGAGSLDTVDEKKEKDALGTTGVSSIASAAAAHSRASSTASNMQPDLSVPKRKGLTFEQIDRAPAISEATKAQNRSYPPPRKSSLSSPAPPASILQAPQVSSPTSHGLVEHSPQAAAGLANVLNSHEPIKRKPVHRPASPNADTAPLPSHAPPAEKGPSDPIAKDNTDVFAKPTWPASARPVPSDTTQGRAKHQPTLITSLSRPVFPPAASPTSTLSANPSPTTPTGFPSYRRPSAPASTLAAPSSALMTAGGATMKPRAPSPSLLKRMPSFESRGTSEGLGDGSAYGTPNTAAAIGVGTKAPARAHTVGPTRAVKKLDLKTSSVEGLRKLYEERVGLAEGLKGMGRR